MTTSQSTTARKTAPAKAAKATPKAAAVEQADAVQGTVLREVTFIFERETKGAVRYAEVQADGQDEPVIGSLYLRKAHLDGKVPSAVRVTITDLTAGA
jgi:hypothetical protein